MPYRDEEPSRNQPARLIAKIVACCGVFGVLLAWGWISEIEINRRPYPPAMERMLELGDHPSIDVPYMRVYGWKQAHQFQPRQYVKIIRMQQAPKDPQANQS